MPYSAIVFNFMLSSPSDAEDERNSLREVINAWNDANSKSYEQVLLPLDFLKNVAPQLAIRGQDVINEKIVKKSDCLVGVFKNSLGTPTEDFESGTIEEIELFRKEKPQNPCMVYFFSGATDERLLEFKNRFDKAYWKEYDDKNDLIRKFWVDLISTVNTETLFKVKPVDSVHYLEKRTLVLLTAILNSSNKEINISKRIEGDIYLRTDGCDFFGYESVLNYIINKKFVEKSPGADNIYHLTELGEREVKWYYDVGRTI